MKPIWRGTLLRKLARSWTGHSFMARALAVLFLVSSLMIPASSRFSDLNVVQSAKAQFFTPAVFLKGSSGGSSPVTIYLTTGTKWVAPNNIGTATIELIAGGGAAGKQNHF